METVPQEVTRKLIQNQLTAWRTSMEDYRIAGIVAETLDDAAGKERVVKEMTKCVKAIEKLTAMLNELG